LIAVIEVPGGEVSVYCPPWLRLACPLFVMLNCAAGD
jgi:hypothetical protein